MQDEKICACEQEKHAGWKHACQDRYVKQGFTECKSLCRVPTSSGNHGKPGKSQKKSSIMEKSWSFVK